MDLRIAGSIPGGPHWTVGDTTYELPTYFDVVATGLARLPYEVKVGVRMYSGGPRAERVELVQLKDDRGRPTGPHVTGTALRELALTDLLGRAVEEAVTVAENITRDERGHGATLRTATAAERGRFVTEYRRSGRKRPSEQRLETVAEVYRRALVLGDRPTQAVADELGVARSTAGRLVSQAREHGYLRPAPGPRLAGEVPEEGQS
jgi:hypothetical protein